MESSNGLAHVELMKLAQAARESRLAEREEELEEREEAIAERESHLELGESWARMEEGKRDRIRVELEELERARDELRAAIEREAREHDMEPRTFVRTEGHSGAKFKRPLEGRDRRGDAASELERLRRIAGELPAWSGDAPTPGGRFGAGGDSSS